MIDNKTFGTLGVGEVASSNLVVPTITFNYLDRTVSFAGGESRWRRATFGLGADDSLREGFVRMDSLIFARGDYRTCGIG